MTNFGVMFRCQKAPEEIPEFARSVESAGFDELWVVEDCFFHGGISGATAALSATERLNVGLGIVPAVARNSAFTAMEFSTLARLYPGRFLPAIGHGVAAWMRQIGAFPVSQLAALEETTQAVRALLRGELFTLNGRHVNLEAVQLEYPPDPVPPVQLGVRGPKSLELSGRSADGTILAEGAAPDYIRWAKEHIQRGQVQTGRKPNHRLTVYVLASINESREVAREALRLTLAASLPHYLKQLEPVGLREEAETLIQSCSADELGSKISDRWFEELTVSGTPEDCAQAIERFVDAGVDSLVFVFPFDDEKTQMAALAKVALGQ